MARNKKNNRDMNMPNYITITISFEAYKDREDFISAEHEANCKANKYAHQCRETNTSSKRLVIKTDCLEERVVLKYRANNNGQ
jgi:hypothetical protein